MPFMGRAFSMSVWYLLKCMKIVKYIDVLCNVVFVICKIHGSIKDIEIKDSKDMRL